MTVTPTRVQDINIEVTCPHCGVQNDEMIWKLELIAPTVEANCLDCDKDYTYTNPFAEIARKLMGFVAGGEA